MVSHLGELQIQYYTYSSTLMSAGVISPADLFLSPPPTHPPSSSLPRSGSLHNCASEILCILSDDSRFFFLSLWLQWDGCFSPSWSQAFRGDGEGYERLSCDHCYWLTLASVKKHVAWEHPLLGDYACLQHRALAVAWFELPDKRVILFRFCRRAWNKEGQNQAQIRMNISIKILWEFERAFDWLSDCNQFLISSLSTSVSFSCTIICLRDKEPLMSSPLSTVGEI